MNNCGSTLLDKYKNKSGDCNDLNRAEDYIREALQGKLEFYGESHPWTLRIMSDLGKILICQQNFEKAESLLTKTYKLQCSILGTQYIDSMNTMIRLVSLYYESFRSNGFGNWNESKISQVQIILETSIPHCVSTWGEMHYNSTRMKEICSEMFPDAVGCTHEPMDTEMDHSEKLMIS